MQPLSENPTDNLDGQILGQTIGLETSLAQAKALDRNMRMRLADSLVYIGDACAGRVPFDENAHEETIAAIRMGPVPAWTFAAYGDLVLALDDNDIAKAETLFTDIAAILSAPNNLGVFRFRPPEECAVSARYLRWMDTDPEQDLCVLPLTDGEAESFDALLSAAWRILDAGVPEMAAQTRFLAREIIVARGNRDPKAMVFDGASSFLLWGAILINADTHKSAFELAQALVHESGHNLLFNY